MKRGVWFVAGIGAGVYGMVRARRVAEAFTPDGARDRLAGWRLGARMMVEEFVEATAEREDELRHRFGLVPDAADAGRELTPGSPPTDSPDTISAAGAHLRDLERTTGMRPRGLQEGTD